MKLRLCSSSWWWCPFSRHWKRTLGGVSCNKGFVGTVEDLRSLRSKRVCLTSPARTPKIPKITPLLSTQDLHHFSPRPTRASMRNCGTCVDFPQPVSPTTSVTGCSFTASTSCARAALAGKLPWSLWDVMGWGGFGFQGRVGIEWGKLLAALAHVSSLGCARSCQADVPAR